MPVKSAGTLVLTDPAVEEAPAPFGTMNPLNRRSCEDRRSSSGMLAMVEFSTTPFTAADSDCSRGHGLSNIHGLADRADRQLHIHGADLPGSQGNARAVLLLKSFLVAASS